MKDSRDIYIEALSIFKPKTRYKITGSTKHYVYFGFIGKHSQSAYVFNCKADLFEYDGVSDGIDLDILNIEYKRLKRKRLLEML